MPTIKVTDESFDQVVLKSEKPFLQRFTAEWCGPCKMIAPMLEELSVELADKVSFGVHNIDDEPNTPTRFGVRGIPTMLLFKGGKVVDTKVGASSKQQIKDWILSKI
ncbi:MAG: thioredoxin [Candidatus Fonsibacter sp.]|jgi:thioredoxin 1|uniref:thioredoxin n=1 Tax=Candidatus Fonsibacter ubiquis TaxID=1925548 RepID=UPI000C0756A0|nr:thioredoxin [Candidatus Fonsibacter ubiquis]NDA91440.1 thioredoxin [Alphaproteobacteria bacterium]